MTNTSEVYTTLIPYSHYNSCCLVITLASHSNHGTHSLVLQSSPSALIQLLILMPKDSTNLIFSNPASLATLTATKFSNFLRWRLMASPVLPGDACISGQYPKIPAPALLLSLNTTPMPIYHTLPIIHQFNILIFPFDNSITQFKFPLFDPRS